MSEQAWQPGDPVYPRACSGALNVRGEQYDCDHDFEHDVHGNTDAGAIWSDNASEKPS
jgi:hypothetical protein